MKYLLDTNVYISFYDRFYPEDVFPSFWEKFTKILQECIVIPDIVVKENVQSKWFKDYLKKSYHKPLIKQKDYIIEWQEVLQYIANNPCYSDKALTEPKSWANDSIADAWIIAISKKEEYTLVTNETANVSLSPARPTKAPKIPDIARAFDVRCITSLEFLREKGLKI